MSSYTGYFAALGTSFLWTFTPLFFTLAAKRVGSTIVNRVRLLFAIIFVMLMHRVMEGTFFPVEAEPFRLGWLALSGIIGYVIGDSFLFQGLVMIGPRLTMLMLSLAPALATVMGWVLFGEVLSPQELTGIALTIAGVGMVISDRQSPDESEVPAPEERTTRDYVIGILFGLVAALGQAGGLVASRLGLVGDFPALSGNLIRLTAATIVIWIITLIAGQFKVTVTRLREHPQAVAALTGGAFFGPFIGVWLSLIAIQLAPLGIASTLMGLPPIFLVPVSWLVYKERIGRRAVIGTLLAFAGTALIFLPPDVLRLA